MKKLFLIFFLFPATIFAQISVDIESFVETLVDKNIEIARQHYKVRETQLASKSNYLGFVPKLSGRIEGNSSILENSTDMIQKNMNLTVSQLLFNGGRTIKSLQNSKDLESQEMLKLLSMIESQKTDAKNIFYEYLLVLEQSKILEQKLLLLEKQTHHSQKLRELGKTTELEMLTAEVNLEEARLSNTLINQQLEISLTNIKHELGLEQSEEIIILGNIYDMQRNKKEFNLSIEDSLNNAEQNNLKIQISDKIIKQVKNSIYNYNTIALPTITGDFKVTTIANQKHFDQLSYNFVFNLNFPIPVLPVKTSFQVGRGIHDELNSSFSINFSLLENVNFFIEKQQLDREHEFLKHENLLLRQNTRTKIQQLFQEIETNKTNMKIIEDKINLSQKRVDIYQKMYELGKITNIELFDAINSQYEAELEKLRPLIQIIKLEDEIIQLTGYFESEELI